MSSVFTTGYHKGQPYVADSVVKNFIRWTKTLKDNVVLQKTAVGGYYCYPQPPLRSLQSLTDASGEGIQQLVYQQTLHLLCSCFPEYRSFLISASKQSTMAQMYFFLSETYRLTDIGLLFRILFTKFSIKQQDHYDFCIIKWKIICFHYPQINLC